MRWVERAACWATIGVQYALITAVAAILGAALAKADTKISAMPAASALTGPELVPVVQGGANVTTTPGGLLTYIEGQANTWSSLQTLSAGVSWAGDASICRVVAGVLEVGDASCDSNGQIYAAAFNAGPTPSGQLNTSGVRQLSTGLVGWSSSTSTVNTVDTTLCRASAGVVEIASSNGCAASGGLIAATINGNTITAGTSTFSGSAAATYTFPTTSQTIAGLSAGQSWTGLNTNTTGVWNFSSTGALEGNGDKLGSGTAVSGCAEAGTGSPTCSITKSAGSFSEQVTLASSSLATAITITFPNAVTNLYICDGFDFTTTTERLKQTGGSTTTAVITYYNDVGVATSPGATDVLYIECTGN